MLLECSTPGKVLCIEVSLYWISILAHVAIKQGGGSMKSKYQVRNFLSPFALMLFAAILVMAFQNCSRQAGFGVQLDQSTLENGLPSTAGTNPTPTPITTPVPSLTPGSTPTPGSSATPTPGSSATPTPTPTVGSQSCQPDPVFTTEYYKNAVTQPVIVVASLCKDGPSVTRFVVGQRIYLKIIPNNVTSGSICISPHNHTDHCLVDSNFAELPNETFVYDQSQGVLRAEVVVDSSMAGNGYIFNFKGPTYNIGLGGWMIFPEGLPADAQSFSDAVISSTASGSQVNTLKVGQTAYVRVPADSKAQMLTCIEDLANDSSCRRLSDFAALGAEASVSGGYLRFSTPIISDYVGKKYVIRFYDNIKKQYHETAAVVNITN